MTNTHRPLPLIALFVVASWFVVQFGSPVPPAEPRWPTDDEFYRVDGWRMSAATVDASRPNLTFVSRTYVTPDGSAAQLIESASPIAKSVYRAGAAVPFQGSGYSVVPASNTLVPAREGRGSFIATRGDEAWLEVDAYGERRGQLGSGPMAWLLTGFDSLVGRPNDYYLVRVLVNLSDASQAARAVELADTLFPRFANWYAALS